jgi:ribokinase
MDVAVVGQVARDLVLLVDDVPEPGRSVPVRVALVGVVGDDVEADRVRDRARADGIDVHGVIRGGAPGPG